MGKGHCTRQPVAFWPFLVYNPLHFDSFRCMIEAFELFLSFATEDSMKSPKFTSTPLFPRQALVALLLPLIVEQALSVTKSVIRIFSIHPIPGL